MDLENKKLINKSFFDTFGQDINYENWSRDDQVEWDSLGSFNLIANLETNLSVNIPTSSIEKLNSFDSIFKEIETLKTKKVIKDSQYLFSSLIDIIEGKDFVLLHSTLHEFCKSIDEAKKFVQQLHSIASKTNTVFFIPAFTDKFLKTGYIDMKLTPSKTGLLSELLLREKGAEIIGNPFYRYILIKDKNNTKFSKLSCIENNINILNLFKSTNSIIIWMGDSSKKSFTFLRYIEEENKVPYRFYKTFIGTRVFNRVKQKYEFKMYVKRMDEENIFVDNKNAFEDCQSSDIIKTNAKIKNIFFANSKDLAREISNNLKKNPYYYAIKTKKPIKNHIFQEIKNLT